MSSPRSPIKLAKLTKTAMDKCTQNVLKPENIRMDLRVKDPAKEAEAEMGRILDLLHLGPMLEMELHAAMTNCKHQISQVLGEVATPHSVGYCVFLSNAGKAVKTVMGVIGGKTNGFVDGVTCDIGVKTPNPTRGHFILRHWPSGHSRNYEFGTAEATRISLIVWSKVKHLFSVEEGTVRTHFSFPPFLLGAVFVVALLVFW
jgi:hypothetical protein